MFALGRFRFRFLLALLLLSVWVSSPTWSVETVGLPETRTGHLETLSFGNTLHQLHLDAGQDRCFMTWLPASGILQVTASAENDAQVAVEALGRQALLRQGITGFQLAAWHEGEHVYCVFTQDSRPAMAKVRVAFVELAVDQLESRWRPLLGFRPVEAPFDGDPGEEEVIPDPLPSPQPLIQPFDGDPGEEEVIPDPQPQLQPFDGDPGEEEVIPDPRPQVQPMDGDPGEEEVIPDPTPQPQPVIAARYDAVEAELCRSTEADDHGESAFCGTVVTLGSFQSGRIENPWADDEDHFVFEIGAAENVVLKGFSEVDLTVGLYDDRGHLLGLAESTADGVQLSRTLFAGRYSVRVSASHQGEGMYQLSLSAGRR